MNSDWEFLCGECVSRKYLAEEIQKLPPQVCGFCQKESPAIEFNVLVQRVRVVLWSHYAAGQEMKFFDGLDDDRGSWETTGDDTVEIIGGLLECEDESIAEAIYDALGPDLSAYMDGDTEAFPETLDERENDYFDTYFNAEWKSFKISLFHERRFFIDPKESILKDIFIGLEHLAKEQNVPLVKVLEVGDTLWRARDIRKLENLKDVLSMPSLQLGPPPSEVSKAGRMNPHGIAVFYGSWSRETCLKELRPPVGSYVICGQFRVRKKLKLLDLKCAHQLKNKKDWFDPDWSVEESRIGFIGSFDREIARPVLPEDEALHYVPTQAVVEYIAHEMKLDGLIYSSAQGEKHEQNIVLFQHAARVFNPFKKWKVNDVRSYDVDSEQGIVSAWHFGQEELSTQYESSFFGEIDLKESIAIKEEQEAILELIESSIGAFKVKGVTYDAPWTPVEYKQMKNRNYDE